MTDSPAPRAIRHFGFAAMEARAQQTRRAVAPRLQADIRPAGVQPPAKRVVVRLWLPMTPIFLLMAPFAFLLAPLIWFAPPLAKAARSLNLAAVSKKSLRHGRPRGKPALLSARPVRHCRPSITSRA